MLEVKVRCPDCDEVFYVHVDYACPYCNAYFEHTADLREHIEDCHISSPSVHVHRPPAVTLNETPEESHISTGLCQKI